MKEYVFIREDVFYIIPCKDDEDAIACAKINTGTLEVRTVLGVIMWSLPIEDN